MYSASSCSECQPDHLVTDPQSGEVICSMCGLVLQEKMQETKIQFYERGMDLRGIEPSSLAYYDMGLSTIIGKTNSDAKGQSIEPSVRSTIHRLRTWDHRIQLHGSKETNLKKAFYTLNLLKDKLSLSDVTIEKVAYIYRKALTKVCVRGRSIESVLVAAAYIAMEEMLSNISLREISKVSNIHPKTIGRMVMLLSSELGIMIPLADPIRCVTKVGNIVGLSEKTKRQAVTLVYHVKESGYSDGKTPMGIAATILYFVCSKTRENITLKKIAKAKFCVHLVFLAQTNLL
jgi:transcription initiation factor TFIIB